MNAAKTLPLLEVFTQQYSPYNKEEVAQRRLTLVNLCYSAATVLGSVTHKEKNT